MAQPMIVEQPRIIRETRGGYTCCSIADEMLSSRQIQCVGEINEELVNSLIGQLWFLQKEDPQGEIKMYVNSPGGSVDAGMALYDVMQAVSCPIRTLCVGLAASMGALIFISGNARDMLPHSRIMIHDPLVYNTGGSALQLKSISEDLMETREIMAHVLAEHSGKTLEEVYQKTSHDSFFRAKEALEFGLADRIITKL